ncbi:MAG TPA: PilT/PilU family type 4a pilus ATPase [Candidatus Paceibacterota bacterium]|nr:PilT/PilU family type 4a pilus ATPase [Verrucomicrobiota bacterium]HSA11791.1 PilT/PilU family type 4a pilus ATPase [Candidatus Paceibacterota bacterium]
MDLESLISLAADNGASDLHLEAGLPPAMRIRGELRTTGEPLPANHLAEMARAVTGEAEWPRFLEQRSYDCSRNIAGSRCRLNIFMTSRGVGFAIRLLAAFTATIEKLNLHPDFKKLVSGHHGLILVSGATGSGKSSTLAALIEQINMTETRHILTIESPIEFTFRPRRAYIRQREVGRDTPSFEQALIDSLREDPDVLMVGEMRDPETMRLTLSAAETGHLVMATVHSSTCAEALQRVVSAFPAEIQSSVAAQLADCMLAVISQRLHFRPELKIRVPECEILVPTHAVKNFIRNRDFFKISSSLETGAEHGMWTLQRYRSWLASRKSWYIPGQSPEPGDGETAAATPAPERPPAFPISLKPAKTEAKHGSRSHTPGAKSPARIEIEPGDSEFGKILKRPGEQ